MPNAFAAAKVQSLVVEDDLRDKSEIEHKLRATDVFAPAIYDNYRQGFAMEHARAADIVALDVEVERVKQNSIDIAKKLKQLNPDQSVIFFTSSPHEVLTQPINFVLDKSAQVWDSYERLLMRILIHDKSLALLKYVNDFCMRPDTQRLGEVYRETQESIGSFVPSLISIQGYFQRDDKPTARRYGKLLRLLKGTYHGDPRAGRASRTLRNMRQPLLDVVLDEVGRLKQIDGVYVTPKLNSELEYLKDLIMHDESASGLLFDRAKVCALEGTAGVLHFVNQFLKGMTPAAGTTRGAEPAALEQWPHKEIDILYADDALFGDEVVDDGLYLNAWFPDYDDDDSLKVGVAARLRVNIDMESRDGSLGASESIPPDKAQILYTVGHIDVMVISPDADVTPLLKRLEMPPSAERFVEFKVTARAGGPINLTVALLVCNEPIYRTVFSCEAKESTAAAATAAAAEIDSVASEESTSNEVNYGQL